MEYALVIVVVFCLDYAAWVRGGHGIFLRIKRN